MKRREFVNSSLLATAVLLSGVRFVSARSRPGSVPDIAAVTGDGREIMLRGVDVADLAAKLHGQLLLAGDAEYPRERIDQIVESGKTVLVPLKNPMPVHVVYMTTWTDEDGVLQFRKDMYKYDRYAALPKDLQPTANLVAETQQQPEKPKKTESK